MGVISWASTYGLKAGNKFSPVPSFLHPHFSNGVFQESLHTLGSVIGTWSMFTCDYRPLLSMDRMSHKPSYDYAALTEDCLMNKLCFNSFMLVLF